MYALFFEGSQDILATSDKELHAVALGRMLSRETGRTVICVENMDDGSTRVYARFVLGQPTLDPADTEPAAAIVTTIRGLGRELPDAEA